MNKDLENLSTNIEYTKTLASTLAYCIAHQIFEKVEMERLAYILENQIAKLHEETADIIKSTQTY